MMTEGVADTPRARNTLQWWLYLALAAAAAFRVWGIAFGLPHPEARPDESVLIARAMGVLGGDLNPHFFNYPSLFIYVLASLFGLLYVAGLATGLTTSLAHFAALSAADPTPLYLIARLLSAACGAATILAVYALGRRLHSPRAGVIGAWLLAIDYLHVRESHFGVTDVPLTFLVTVAVAALARAADTGRIGDFARAGAIAGLAVSTKYNAAILGLPMLLAALAPPVRVQRVLVNSAVAAGLMALTALAATPFAVLDWPQFQRDVTFELRHLQVGHASVDLGPGWLRHAVFTLPVAVGLPAIAAAIAGVVVTLRQRFWLSLVVWTFPAAYYYIAGSTDVVFVRYMAPITPFLAIAAGVALVAAAEAASRLVAPPVRLAAAVLVAVLVAGGPLVRVVSLDRRLAQADTRVIAADWLAQKIVPGESVYQAGSQYEHLRIAGIIDAVSFDEGGNRFTGGVSARRPDWIVLPRSASPYSRVPCAVEDLVTRCYQQLLHVEGAGTAPLATFDVQDAFFLPYADPGLVQRPGPDIVIYRDAGRCD